ncbi:MAG: hypothetical protein AB1806_17300 [Acidobacteriota bacterium]
MRSSGRDRVWSCEGSAQRALAADDAWRDREAPRLKRYHGPKLYYVGLTRNLFGRVRWHLRDRHARKWDGFVIFRIKRVNYLKDIETLLTRLVTTPGNRVKGKVPRDADINRVLRVILREETAEIRKIAKALR